MNRIQPTLAVSACSILPLVSIPGGTNRGDVAESGYQYFVTGTPRNGTVPKKAGVALMGGGTDQDAAFQWMCESAGSGNFLVLRASGTDAYNSYIKKLCPAIDAVETLVITSREAAHQQFLVDRLRNATALSSRAAVKITTSISGKALRYRMPLTR